MTNVLHWRKTTWALVLWSGYVAAWALITGPGPAMVALWWLAGMVLLGRSCSPSSHCSNRGLASAACSSGPAGPIRASSTSTEPTG